MLLLKYLLLAAGRWLVAGAGAIIAYDVYVAAQRRRLLGSGEAAEPGAEPARPVGLIRPVRWSVAGKLAGLAWLPLLLGLSIVVVPDGTAGVRVSQISGVRPGTLYPGVHFVLPFVEQVAEYDVRDHVFTTIAAEDPKKKGELLRVTGREGLSIGMAVAVRWRLEPKRLDSIHANLAQPLEEQIVAPVVAAVFRQTTPNYIVREIFATRREELRQRAADAITARLAADGIVVKEVMVRDIVLPAEYAKGLEGLLLKEQENERLGFETEIKQKQVRIAELEAEAHRIRVTAAADAERMKLEALVLKQNPLLIQKIIAERLSDKLQIMMVPTDGKYFFANDVMRSAFSGAGANGATQPEDPPDEPGDAPRPNGTQRPRNNGPHGRP